MGNTLQRAAEWTSAQDSARLRLEFTPQNEKILNEILRFVEGLPGSLPAAAQLQFRTPVTWRTQLKPGDFGPPDFSVSDGKVDSEAKGKDKSSLLTLRLADSKDDVYEVSASTLDLLVNILNMAGPDRKLGEVRSCLEANQDPLAKMCGDRFATTGQDSGQLRYMQEIMRSKPAGEEGEDDETQEKMAILEFVMKCNDFDTVLLSKSVESLSSEVRMTPSEVDHKVALLSQLCGEDDEKDVSKCIKFADLYTHVFSNGCRAHPQRQTFGDIAYIQVEPHDGEKFFVTASTSGYYVNKGFNSEQKDLQYEREGEYFKDLVALIRSKSAVFGQLIDKQDLFQLHEEDKSDGIIIDLEKNQSHHNVGDQQTGRSEAPKEDAKGKSTDRKKKEEKKKKLEPSLKWKTLGLDENKEEEEQEKKDTEKKRKSGKKRKGRDSTKTLEGDAEDSFEESSSESEEEEETPDRRNEVSSDLPSEYWQIQKLVKYLKGGNQTATIISLCAMRDFNLAQETCQLAIRDVGGLEVLINLLDTEENKCKIGTLMILKEISKNTQIRRAIADLGGLQTMVKILQDPNKELKCLAAETIANVAKFRRARRTVRQHNGIKKLVGLLDCAPINNAQLTREHELDVDVARCGALALWSCSKSTRNKQAMRQAGAIPLLARLLKSPHENMLIPVVGTLQECATEPSYRLAIRTEGMVEDLVNNLKSENEELQMHCASAIFKCAEEKDTRDLVRQFGGLDPLVSLLTKTENKELLAAATGAIWKCSISPENVARFQELKAIDLLVGQLNNQPEEVLVNVVGALAELAQGQANRLTIRKAGGIPPLVDLLTGTNQALLVNVTKAVGQCAQESENMVVIDKLDGVRLLWSLLKNPNPEVQASAAWAICPCIENAKDAGEMVRSFVGGLELIVSLLKSEDKEVLASVCAAIANIANDEENLAVITDHGVVPMLAKLTNTQDDRLRRHLAEAIARCCNWGNNRVAFGEAGAVAPLVKYLKSSDIEVHRSTARALYQLSRDPDNCITMHDSGVVKPLMEMVGSFDDVLQEAAAGCIANIRRLALANEKSRNK